MARATARPGRGRRRDAGTGGSRMQPPSVSPFDTAPLGGAPRVRPWMRPAIATPVRTSAPAVVVLVEAEAGSAGAFGGGVPVGGGEVLGVGMFLADSDQALQAAPGTLEGRALL